MINNDYVLNLSAESYQLISQFGNKKLSSIRLNNKKDLKEFLDLLLIKNLSFSDKIHFSVNDEIAKEIEKCLSELGYAHLLYNEIEDKESLSLKISESFHILSKKWETTLKSTNQQFKNALEPIKTHLDLIQVKTLAPVSFQSLVQTYRLRSLNQPINFALDLNIDSTNYTINKKEFLFLREKIEKALTLFDKSFVDNPKYDQFNSILFDVLTARESYHLVEDQLTIGIELLKSNKIELESYILQFKNDLFNYYHAQIADFQTQYKKIKIECNSIEMSTSSNVNIGHKILSKLKSSNQYTTDKKQLIQRYIQLVANWNNTIFKTTIELNDFSDWKGLIHELGFDRFNKINWGKIIQDQIAGQITRLTYNNSPLDFFPLKQITLLKQEITDTINEVNKNKIFNHTIENNTLYLKDTLQFITQTIANWDAILCNLEIMKEYHPWRKFWEEVSPKVKKICTVLFLEKKENWLWVFENWYFRLLIEGNMNSQLFNNHKGTAQLANLNERQSNILKASLQNKLTDSLKEDVLQLKTKHSEIKKWRPQSQDFPLVSGALIEEIKAIFPISIVSNNTVVRSNNLITIKPTEPQEGYNFTFEGIEGDTTSNSITNQSSSIRFEPSTDISIIQSNHSHRWEQVKEIAQYLSSYSTEVGFLESKDLFVLSFSNNKLSTSTIKKENDHRIKLIRSSDHPDFIIKLTESLLDNRRRMCFETLDGCLYKLNDPKEMVRQYKLIEFLKYIGLEELSKWSKDINLWGLNSTFIHTEVSKKEKSGIRNLPTKVSRQIRN